MAADDTGNDVKAVMRQLLAGETGTGFLFLMLVLDFAGTAMLIPVAPFFAMEELGLGARELGFVLSLHNLSQFCGCWFCGKISDTYGRRPLVLACFLGSAVGFSATAFVQTFAQFLAVRMMQGLSGGTYAICQAYVLDKAPKSQRAAFMGLFGCIIGLSFAIGPALGGLLIWFGTPRRVIFLIAGAVVAVAAVLGIVCLDESLPMAKRRPLFAGSEASNASDWEVVGKGLSFVWLTRFLQALASGFMHGTYAFLIADLFNWSDVHLGAMLVTAGLTSALLQLLVFPVLVDLWGPAWVLVTGCLLGCGAFVLFPHDSVWTHVPAMIIFAAGGACCEPSIPMLVGFFAGDRHLGFANGIAGSLRSIGTALAPALAGMLYEHNRRTAFYIGAGVFVAASLSGTSVACATRDAKGETEPLTKQP